MLKQRSHSSIPAVTVHVVVVVVVVVVAAAATAAAARSHQQKIAKLPISQCKTSIGNKSGSIKGRAIKSAYNMGLSAMADRMA